MLPPRDLEPAHRDHTPVDTLDQHATASQLTSRASQHHTSHSIAALLHQSLLASQSLARGNRIPAPCCCILDPAHGSCPAACPAEMRYGYFVCSLLVRLVRARRLVLPHGCRIVTWYPGNSAKLVLGWEDCCVVRSSDWNEIAPRPSVLVAGVKDVRVVTVKALCRRVELTRESAVKQKSKCARGDLKSALEAMYAVCAWT